MTAQDATKARKNAKARRKKKKDGGSGKDSVSVRSDKGGASSAQAPKGSLPERIVRYWRGVIAETKRVSWPGKPELIAGTITSITVLVIFAGWLGGLDFILRKLLG